MKLQFNDLVRDKKTGRIYRVIKDFGKQVDVGTVKDNKTVLGKLPRENLVRIRREKKEAKIWIVRLTADNLREIASYLDNPQMCDIELYNETDLTNMKISIFVKELNKGQIQIRLD